MGRRIDEYEQEPPRRTSKLPFVLGGCAALCVVCVLLMVPVFRIAKREANATKCNSELRVAGLAAQAYAETERRFPYAGGDFAATLELLRKAGHLSGEFLERDPACPEADGRASYDGFKAPWAPYSGEKTPEFVAWELQPHTTTGYRRVLMYEGYPSVISEAEFQEGLAKHDALAKERLETLSR